MGYSVAMHTTDTSISPGNGITCGALRAGGFSKKRGVDFIDNRKHRIFAMHHKNG